jgi:hypothetical protein
MVVRTEVGGIPLLWCIADEPLYRAW